MNSATVIPPESLETIDTTEVELRGAVQQALAATGYAELQQVGVEIHAGEVYLWGILPTYYQKQLAQEAVKGVDGVESLNNEIRVVQTFSQSPTSGESAP